MNLSVIDANGVTQQVSVAAPGLAADASGVVLATLPSPGPATYQQILPIATAPSRSGWRYRNLGASAQYLSEDGTAPAANNPTSVLVYPGEIFPPPGVAYPITQGAVLMAGIAGDAFSLKVW